MGRRKAAKKRSVASSEEGAEGSTSAPPQKRATIARVEEKAPNATPREAEALVEKSPDAANANMDDAAKADAGAAAAGGDMGGGGAAGLSAPRNADANAAVDVQEKLPNGDALFEFLGERLQMDEIHERGKADKDDNLNVQENLALMRAGSQYMAGSIYRIHLVNFITYDNVEIKPGPRLNVVVGPNGSGKSSLVCALALGLAGKPDLLGRAKKYAEFIKHGCDYADIELELHDGVDGKHNTVVRRRIKNDNTSLWWLNGLRVNASEVSKSVLRQRIQVDNLCQFLPQDRVAAFSMMAPREVLRETERAIGGAELLQMHDELITLTAEYKLERGKSGSDEKRLAELQKEHDRDEARVMRTEKRLEWQALLELAKQKLPWVQFEEKRTEAIDLKDEYLALQPQLAELQQQLAPWRARIANLKELEEQDSDKYTIALQAANDADRKVAKAVSSLDTLRSAHAAAVVSLREWENAEQNRERQIAKLEVEIGKLEEKLGEMGDYEADQGRLDAMEAQYKEAKSAVAEINSNRLAAEQNRRRAAAARDRANRELAGLGQTRQRRMQQLRNVNFKVYENALWVEEQRRQNRFKGQVYLVCLEVEAKDEASAIYLENAMPNWLLTAFVCTEQSDRNLIVQHRGGAQHSANAIFVQSRPQFRHALSSAQLQALGLIGYLDEFVDAPQAVKDALQANISICDIAVGTANTNNAAVVNSDQVRFWFTPKTRFQVSHSRYGQRARNTKAINIEGKQARMLGSGSVSKLTEQWKQKIREATEQFDMATAALADIAESSKQHDKVVADYQNLKQSLAERKQDFHRTQRALDAKRKELEQLTDQESLQKKLDSQRTKIKKVLQKRLAAMKTAADLEVARGEKLAYAQTMFFKRLDARHQVKLMEGKIAKVSDKYDGLLATHDELRRTYKTAKDMARSYRPDYPLTEELKAKFTTVPPPPAEADCSSGELKTFITEMEVKLDASAKQSVLSDKQLEEHRRRKREIDALQARIDTEVERLADKRAAIEAKRAQWLPIVRDITELLGVQFRRLFQTIGCRGDVVLHYDAEKVDDYDKYELRLLVSYRREEIGLQVLSAQQHSGGERSVATMLFLVSLQSMTKCPFRLVDEINQGMDPSNERMIFREVVAAATRPGLPQYFLVTPKLLSNLKYNGLTTVLCVFNGPHQIPARRWNMDAFKSAMLAQKRRRLNGDGVGEKENEKEKEKEKENAMESN